MKRNSKTYLRLRKYHKWFSVFLSLFVLVFAFSGIVLNHRGLFSSVDVNRNWLPEVYRYQNWNLAAVRGSLHLQGETSLVYGNIGVWITRDDFQTFGDLNQGFPPGIDNRKISKIIKTPQNQIFAGTLFGLYLFDNRTSRWRNLELPGPESRVVDLLVNGDELWIFTRSFLLKANYTRDQFEATLHTLPPPQNYDNKAGLFKTLWVIHSGEIYGMPGKIFVDLMALVFIFLTITGLILWLFPGLIRRLKHKGKRIKAWSRIVRFSLKWHNKLGYYLVPFLILTAVTGMFLRPPLLIPIATMKTAKIPFTVLDSPNPWFDKLRAAIIEPASGRIILSTSDGFFYSDDQLSSLLKPFDVQPPVSVMGINVFDTLGNSGFLVGSFSGLYSWFPDHGYVENVLTRETWVVPDVAGPPFTDNAIAGMVWTVNSGGFLFDYADGVYPFLHTNGFPDMPVNILRESPVSAWNTALEFHTARIYAAIIGDLYILIIPLAGLSVLFILISGLLMYWAGFRKNKKAK